MKKIISLLLCALLLASAVLSGCSGDVMDSRKAEASKDKYRNFYEIFTQSYCDSDGDAIGDLQGIISQLDYLNDGRRPKHGRGSWNRRHLAHSDNAVKVLPQVRR